MEPCHLGEWNTTEENTLESLLLNGLLGSMVVPWLYSVQAIQNNPNVSGALRRTGRPRRSKVDGLQGTTQNIWVTPPSVETARRHRLSKGPFANL